MLTPGVTYERQLLFTPHGPEVIHVMTAPRPGGLYALRPMLSNDTVLGRETVTAMERRASASATVGGVTPTSSPRTRGSRVGCTWSQGS